MTTESLSYLCSEFDVSPYQKNDLVSLAVETRNYTVESYGRDGSDEAARENLAEVILNAARSSSSADSPTFDRWDGRAISVVEGSAGEDALTAVYELYEAGPGYSFDSEVFDHLDDVNSLISRLWFPMLGITGIAAFFLMYGIYSYGYGSAANPLLRSGIATLVILLIFALLCIFDFDGFFAALHALFFAEGSWTFPADSLLIEMYPESFWIGMGIVWLGISSLLGACSIIFGVIMRRRINAATKVEHPEQ